MSNITVAMTTQDSASRAHHPYSPSKLQSLEASPLYEGIDGDTEASLAGTLQHDVTEQDHIDLDDPRLLDSQMQAVLQCRGYRDSILKTYAEPPSILKELYIPIDNEKVQDATGKEWNGTTAGYLDLALVSKDGTKADIFDWKFGLWSVEPAENNLQGIAYLLGLVTQFPSLATVTVHFVMPHRDEIDSHTFTRDQFPALYLRVKLVVQRAIEARKRLKEGIEQCNPTTSSCLFCGRLGKCKPVMEVVLKLGKKYRSIEIPDNVTPSLIGDIAQSSQLMEIATLMDAWSKATKRQITEHAIDNPDWLPEMYAMQSRANTNILDYKAVREAAKLCGVTDAQLESATKLGMTDIHKAIRDAQPRGEKDAAVEAFTENLIASGAAEKEPAIYFLRRLKT